MEQLLESDISYSIKNTAIIKTFTRAGSAPSPSERAGGEAIFFHPQ